MGSIRYFVQDIEFSLTKPRKTSQWIRTVIEREGRQLENLNYIFCSDMYLLSMNEQYLKHKTLTDIITFDTSENEHDPVEGDIYISVERVEANAEELGTDFREELSRVLVHGVLHLLGYGDKSVRQKSLMRKKEDAYLSLLRDLS